ncbi:RICIN domain-containing protein [Pedobacter nototheniae]|uniref:RICIN domain-containing protein n=1 Tax=Pedobacter nototheniae TaxID=2488994 RepID=UPI00292FEC7A|nr:RICIN domain-containing protein [Pedobacter nototheniae]
MKKIITLGMAVLAVFTVFYACKKDGPEKKETLLNANGNAIAVTNVSNFTSLIAYKNSTHIKTVGYFNGVTRVVTPDYYNLRNIPDSVDIVNVFTRFVSLGNLKRGSRTPGATGEDAKSLTEIIADVDYLQERGTKVVETQFLSEIFDAYKNAAKTAKWQNTPEDYAGYAKAVSDSLNVWGFDGIDLDIEPGFSVGNLTIAQQEAYVNAFAKYFGPTSGTGKLLIVDTNVGFSTLGYSMQTLNKVDYIYIQDYFGSQSSSDDKIDGYIANGYPSNKIMLISADFESSYSSGTTRLKQYYTNSKYSGKVGGFGAYGFNFDKQSNYKNTNDQIKYFNPSAVASTGITSGSTYQLISAVNNSSVLDVTASGTADGTLAELWSANNPKTNNQKWKVISVGSGYYKLQPLNASTKALNVASSGTADGTQIQIYTDNAANAQKWKITSSGDGYYTLSPANAPAKNLDVSGSGTSNGTKVQIWTANSSNAQKWKFVLQ